MEQKFKLWKERFAHWMASKDEKTKREHTNAILIALVVIACAVTSFSGREEEAQEGEPQKQLPTMDTFIPAGHSLVPIEIQNRDSLDSVFGSHGIVDLYTSNQKGQPVRVAERIKLLRSPKNPDVFAVLAKDEVAPQIAGHIGPLFVTINSRKTPPPPRSNSRAAGAKFKIIQEGS